MKKLLLLLIAVLLLGSCRDRHQDEDTLPPATQEGKNTGGALVDGKVWVAKIEAPDSNPGGNNTMYDYANNEYRLSIKLNNLKNPDGNNIEINVTSPVELNQGTYQLNNNYSNRGMYSVISFSTYYTSASNTGVVNITRFDKINKIVSGTFSFTAVNSAGQVVTIKEGRFDKKFL